MAKNHLVEIDALRGLAALVIAAIFHQHFLHGNYRSGPLDHLPVFSWIHTYGWTMVDLFFVISGFIFSHVYLVNGKLETSARNFFAARFARLYPLHLAALLVTALILWIGTPPSFGNKERDTWHFLLNILMLQESGLNAEMSFNVPAWSISVEIFCYIIFFILASRYDILLQPTAVALVFLGFAATAWNYETLDHIGRGLCGFFAGVITYRLRNAPSWLLLPLATLPLLVVSEIRMFSWGAFLSITAYPAWVLLALKLPILGWKVFRWLGERSYSLYLVHAPIYWGISILIFGSSEIPENLVIFALLFSITIILLVSDLSYRLLECPARRFLSAQLSDNGKNKRTNAITNGTNS